MKMGFLGACHAVVSRCVTILSAGVSRYCCRGVMKLVAGVLRYFLPVCHDIFSRCVTMLPAGVSRYCLPECYDIFCQCVTIFSVDV